jgi:hypothetical protein
MANNYLQFSFAVDSVKPDEAIWLRTEHQTLSEAADGLGFEIEFDHADAVFYIFAEEHGDVDQVATFLQRFIRAFRPEDHIGFQWAETCSKPRAGEFGGGCVLVTANRCDFDSTDAALDRMIYVLDKKTNVA